MYVLTYCDDAHQREDLDGAAIFSLDWLVQKLLAKNSCPQMPLF